jgi:hypothetical protein
MSRNEERKRILDLLAAGQIDAQQANDLLTALGSDPEPALPPAPATSTPAAATPTARTLRISIDAQDREGGKENVRIRVNVPLGLAKFAVRFLPSEARSELDAQGIDLSEMIAALSHETPQGRLVDIDVDDDGDGKVVKIVVEVA